MSESEIWKDVVGFEGLYKVSDKGNVFSVERRDSQGGKIGGRILKPSPNIKGYLHLGLYKDGKVKRKLVHRLVLEAFVENPKNLPEVNHIDEIKDNNNIENLEWCTREYNNNHGTIIERSAQARSKKVRAVNIETGEVITFNSTVEARREGYGQGAVSKASRGIYYGGRTYKGYRWYYEEGE